jgi:uncharacterized protein YciW
MTSDIDIWQTTAVNTSGARRGAAAGEALERRANILQMTQTTEDAVLRPTEPGAWPHELRAALASRIARLNGSDALAMRYSLMAGTSEYAALGKPGAHSPDPILAAALAFVDRVATQPKDIAGDDIKTLQAAGIADADIVRLTELVAFMAFQVRLTSGLALLAEINS